MAEFFDIATKYNDIVVCLDKQLGEHSSKSLEVCKLEPPVYFEKLYCGGPNANDICILKHSNRICIVTLSTLHPVVSGQEDILSVDFKISDRTDRRNNKVTGKAKRGGQPLQPGTVICRVITKTQTYSVKSCLHGSLIEINEALIDNPSLLREKPDTTGYIAVVLPKTAHFTQDISSLVPEERYFAKLSLNETVDFSSVMKGSNVETDVNQVLNTLVSTVHFNIDVNERLDRSKVYQNPSCLLLLSGKRKSGKDFVAQKLSERIGDSLSTSHGIKLQPIVNILRLSEPLKTQYAKLHNLKSTELLTDSSYKEIHRESMIRWGEEKRLKNPNFFCDQVVSDGRKSNSKVWIISDARRTTDLDYFKANFGNILLTVRVTADEGARKSRGWNFVDGVDNADSECGLDHIANWDFVINNGSNSDLQSDIKRVSQCVLDRFIKKKR